MIRSVQGQTGRGELKSLVILTVLYFRAKAIAGLRSTTGIYSRDRIATALA